MNKYDYFSYFLNPIISGSSGSAEKNCGTESSPLRSLLRY